MLSTKLIHRLSLNFLFVIFSQSLAMGQGGQGVYDPYILTAEDKEWLERIIYEDGPANNEEANRERMLHGTEDVDLLHNIQEGTLHGAELGGMVGALTMGTPAACVGATVGGTTGFLASIPFAIGSAFLAPAAIICENPVLGLLTAPVVATLAPLYVMTTGTAMGVGGGAMTGGLVGAATGGLLGAGTGAVIGGMGQTLVTLPHAISQYLHGKASDRELQRRTLAEKEMVEKLEKMVDEREKQDCSNSPQTVPVAIADLAPLQEKLECMVCLGDIAPEERSFKLNNCSCEGKAFCEECLKFYLDKNVKGGVYPAPCPGGCHGSLTTADLKALNVPDEEIYQYRKNVLKKKLEKIPGWKYCPTPNCFNGKIVKTKDDKILDCEICKGKNCTICGYPHKIEERCLSAEDREVAMVLSKGKQKRHHSDPELGNIRPCYYCGKMINRIDGCNAVNCGECHREFHWNKGPGQRVHDFDNEKMQYIPLKKPHF